MKLDEFKLLVDENLHSDVVQWLGDQGFDVLDVCDQGLHGTSDADLLQIAFSEDRVILTHDSDFGALAIVAGEPVVGVVYLRPGHIDPRFTIETIETVLLEDLDLTPPFILVAKRKGNDVTIRVRTL